jgi:hypothetical protein
MSRGTGPNNGMPVPISTETRVITNRSQEIEHVVWRSQETIDAHSAKD